MKQITILPAALKTLGKMPANTAKLIRDKIKQYATDPASLANNVITLKGEKGFSGSVLAIGALSLRKTGKLSKSSGLHRAAGAYD